MRAEQADPLGRLAVALDCSEWQTFESWCRLFGPRVGVLKVGLEAFSRWGNRSIEVARREARQVFLDLKLHDIPKTVEGTVLAVREQGIDYLTVHASGGPRMLRVAVEAAAGALKILAVTLLTHIDQHELAALDLQGESGERIARWAALAHGAGCAGVVCSPLEVADLRARNPRPFLLVTPGIRASSDDQDDQRRTASAGEALRAGADLVVVGRPLTRAPDPVEALEDLAREMG